MEDQEQRWEADARRLPVVAAVLYGTLGGVVSFVICMVLFCIVVFVILRVLGSVFSLPEWFFSYGAFWAVWLGSAVVNIVLYRRFRDVSSALMVSFGISAMVIALILLYLGLGIIAIGSIAPD
jgi:hypothetical protein